MNAKVDEPLADRLRRWWFGSVHEIADLDLQRRTWLDIKNENPHWSLVEFVASYPDDDQLQHALAQNCLTSDEFDILSNFRRILVEYSPPGGKYYDHAAVLDDPAWHSVVAAAEHARQQLLSMTSNKQEQAMLLGDV